MIRRVWLDLRSHLFLVLLVILAVLTAAKTNDGIQELETKLERMYNNNNNNNVNDNNRDLTDLEERLSQLYNSNSGDEDGNAQTEEAEEKQGGRPPVMMAKKGQPAAKKGATAGKGENGDLMKLKQLAQQLFSKDTAKGGGKKGGGKKAGGKKGGGKKGGGKKGGKKGGGKKGRGQKG